MGMWGGHAKHKKWAARNFWRKFSAKGNWAEKLILTLSDAFCLNFSTGPPTNPCFQAPPPQPPPLVVFRPFWRQTRSLRALGLPFCFVGRQNLVRVPFSHSALFAWNSSKSFIFIFFCSARALFHFFFLWKFCCANLECCAAHTKAIGTR